MWILLLVLLDGTMVGITPSVKFETKAECLDELEDYKRYNEEYPTYKSMRCEFSEDHK